MHPEVPRPGREDVLEVFLLDLEVCGVAILSSCSRMLAVAVGLAGHLDTAVVVGFELVARVGRGFATQFLHSCRVTLLVMPTGSAPSKTCVLP